MTTSPHEPPRVKAPDEGPDRRPVPALLVVGVLGLGVLVSLFAFGEQLSGFESSQQSLSDRLLPPLTDGHLFGTDSLGRDVFARVAEGFRWSLPVGFLAATMATTIGTVVGVAAGWSDGIIRTLVTRLIDMAISFPYFVLATAIIAVVGRSFATLVIVLGSVAWVSVARVVYAETRALKEREYILAARLLGVPPVRILSTYVLRGLRARILVMFAFLFADLLVAEAALSYLGIGAPVGEPSWGNLLFAAREGHLHRALVAVGACLRGRPRRNHGEHARGWSESAVGRRCGTGMSSETEQRLPVSTGMARTTPTASEVLLEADELTVEFPSRSGWTPVVDGISFQLRRGEALGFVGESGSGKTMSARSLLGLVPRPGRVRGSVRLRGRELVGISNKEWTAIRSREIGMVFQDAMSGLNPVRTIGSMLVEVARRGEEDLSRRDARRKAIDVLDAVGVPSPAERLKVYPHQLSGGLRQRVMIALAIVNEPGIIIADEPTTALDATIQAQIIERLRDLLGERALLLITHDMGVAASMCDRVQVMYAGRMAEAGDANQVLMAPRHPYTAGLLRAVPKFDRSRTPLVPIPGAPPRAGTTGDACAFAPRCVNATEMCIEEEPPFIVEEGRSVACYHPWDGPTGGGL